MGRTTTKHKRLVDINGEPLFEGDKVTYTCSIRKIRATGQIFYTYRHTSHFVLDDGKVRSIHLPKAINTQGVVKILDEDQ